MGILAIEGRCVDKQGLGWRGALREASNTAKSGDIMQSGSSRVHGLIGGGLLALLLGTTLAWADERIQPVPLGGSLAGQRGDKTFGVYVPTRFGGNLTVRSSAGEVSNLSGPDGRQRQNGEDLGIGQHGWYTFRVSGAADAYTVSTEFVQVAQAARMPWNFYYWPTKSDAIHEPWDGTGDGRASSIAVGDDVQVIPYGYPAAPGQDVVRAGPNGILETMPGPGDTSTWFPNLYDDLTFRGADGVIYATPSPLLKYDQLFGQSARGWEAANTQNHDIQRWPGHCLGGAVASIVLNEPVPAPGSGLTQDELKAWWAELGENHYNHQIGDNVNNIPAGPPRPGFDPCDMFVPRFHAMLENHIRGQRKALLSNMRGFPPNGQANEVWNHGVGKYTAKFSAVPGRGERSVRVELETVSNTGSNLNNQDNKPRVNKYEYILVYGLDGNVDQQQAGMCDWISVGGDAIYAPLNVMEVLSSKWQGHNPMVTEANVRAVDLANGGSLSGRFAGAAPNFLPVSSYEAGRPRFAFGNRGGMEDSAPRPRRFRLFGR